MNRKNFARGINAVLDGTVQNKNVAVAPEHTTSVGIAEAVIEETARIEKEIPVEEINQDADAVCKNPSIENVANSTHSHTHTNNHKHDTFAFEHDALSDTGETFEASLSHQIRTSIYMKSDLHQQLKAMAYNWGTMLRNGSHP